MAPFDDDSVLRSEIAEQPAVVARLIERERARVERIGRAIARARVPFVVIAARGSSDNAARYAQYALGIAARLPVALAAPSLTTLYGRGPRVRGALVIGVSQSGASPDVVETLAAARRGGARTLAIVNDDSSPLARAAHDVIALHAGPERSVAATKTYTAELAALALLAASIGGRARWIRDLESVPAAMERALGAEPPAARAARRLEGAARAVVLARGVHRATAYEIALKLKELARLSAEPYSSADFLHGPIAMAAPGLPAIVVAPAGSRAAPELRALAARLRRRGGAVLTIGGDVPVPRVPEPLSPIVAAIAGQLLALHAARARGYDPERPRGLRKVTRTR